MERERRNPLLEMKCEKLSGDPFPKFRDLVQGIGNQKRNKIGRDGRTDDRASCADARGEPAADVSEWGAIREM